MPQTGSRIGILLGIAAVVVVLLIAGIALRRRQNASRSTGSSVSFVASAPSSAQDETMSSDAEAIALWKRTLKAQESLPLRAHAAITRWSADGKPDIPQVLNIVEGSEGRYRFTYISPVGVRGRIVVNDGKSIYQYEPERQVVLRRPTPPVNDLLNGASGEYSTQYIRIAPEQAVFAGRAVQILELRGAKNNMLRERRWVDKTTGRSLRIEEYKDKDHPSRRVELTDVAFTPSAEPATFKANFPRTARVLNATARREPIPEDAARHLDLPGVGAGYRLRSVVQPRSPREEKVPSGIRDPRGEHLLYSNGIHSVSVFATEGNEKTDTLLPAPGWQTVALLPGVVGYATRENVEGRSAIAWTRAGRRYVAVGRLPLERLIVLARALARGANGGN